MKLFGFLSLFFYSSFSFAVVTQNCPQSFDLMLSSFRSSKETPPVDRRLPLLAYSYINVNKIDNTTETLELVDKENGECIYKGLWIKKAKLAGSLKDNAKAPAVLQISFSYYDGVEDYPYVGYIKLADLGKDKLVSFKGKPTLYYSGVYEAYGEEILVYVKVGHFKVSVVDGDRKACLSLESTKEALVTYIKKETHLSERITNWLASSVYRGPNSDDRYRTPTYNHHECAPSTDCWFYFTISCDGLVDEEMGSEG